MPTDGYMDAAAVPVPDAGDDTLRERLAEAIWLTAKGHLRQDESAAVADALLPRIREHIAAAVQGERERAAVAVEELPGPNGEGVAKWPKQHADVYMLAIEEAAAHIRALNDREADDDRR